MDMKYKIKAPNGEWSGIANGVLFRNGLGETDDLDVRNRLINVYGYSDVTEEDHQEEKSSSKKRR